MKKKNLLVVSVIFSLLYLASLACTREIDGQNFNSDEVLDGLHIIELTTQTPLPPTEVLPSPTITPTREREELVFNKDSYVDANTFRQKVDIKTNEVNPCHIFLILEKNDGNIIEFAPSRCDAQVKNDMPKYSDVILEYKVSILNEKYMDIIYEYEYLIADQYRIKFLNEDYVDAYLLYKEN